MRRKLAHEKVHSSAENAHEWAYGPEFFNIR
jgi:hypothetical protein